MSREIRIDLSRKLQKFQEKLAAHGVELDLPDFIDFPTEGTVAGRFKVVCVSSDLKDSVREMGQSPRDQVVMVRVDDETLKDLDAWVGTGAVKSRSEAAALFIREGLKVRSKELDGLRQALKEVEEAKERLQKVASEILGRSEK